MQGELFVFLNSSSSSSVALSGFLGGGVASLSLCSTVCLGDEGGEGVLGAKLCVCVCVCDVV